MMAKKDGAELTWREVIDRVLRESGQALHYEEITDRIIKGGLRRNIGATPSATVNAQIAASIKHDGNRSPDLRVARGTFTLRDGSDARIVQTPKLTPDISQLEKVEEQYEVITLFGMFCKRESIEWKRDPRLLGMQQIGAPPVDFNGQLGVYLLYDGREVVYVGRLIAP